MIIIKEKQESPEWKAVTAAMEKRFGKAPDLQAALFVIGLRELGKRKKKFTKEEKQDLMNLAFCKVMSLSGYFEVTHLDGDGWPVWKQIQAIPPMTPAQQEEMIKSQVYLYFREEKLLD